MTSFQIVSIIISVLALLGAIVAVYIKSQVDIAKIQTTLKFFQRDLDSKEVAICNFEKDNKTDHNLIMVKIDNLIDKMNER